MSRIQYVLLSVFGPMLIPLFICFIRRENAKNTAILATVTVVLANIIVIILQIFIQIDNSIALLTKLVLSVIVSTIGYITIKNAKINARTLFFMLLCFVALITLVTGCSALRHEIQLLKYKTTARIEAYETIADRKDGDKFEVNTLQCERAGSNIVVSLTATAKEEYDTSDTICYLLGEYLPSYNTSGTFICVKRNGVTSNYAGCCAVYANGEIKQNVTAHGKVDDELTMIFIYPLKSE